MGLQAGRLNAEGLDGDPAASDGCHVHIVALPQEGVVRLGNGLRPAQHPLTTDACATWTWHVSCTESTAKPHLCGTRYANADFAVTKFSMNISDCAFVSSEKPFFGKNRLTDMLEDGLSILQASCTAGAACSLKSRYFAIRSETRYRHTPSDTVPLNLLKPCSRQKASESAS